MDEKNDVFSLLGSLFDGIGIFLLAVVTLGIKLMWASTIEAAPISITKRHFPDMLHLGDIAKLNRLRSAIRRPPARGGWMALGSLWEIAGRWLGAFWMPNTSEFPNAADASSLSAIFEAETPGILRRAAMGVPLLFRVIQGIPSLKCNST